MIHIFQKKYNGGIEPVHGWFRAVVVAAMQDVLHTLWEFPIVYKI